MIYFQMPSENVNIFRTDVQLSELVMRTLILAQEKYNQDEQQKFDEESTPEEVLPEENYQDDLADEDENEE